MIRARLIEEELRQGRLNAKTLDSMFRRRIEEGANCSPFVSQAILAPVKEVFSIGSDDAQVVQLGLGQMKLLAVAAEGDVALDVEPLVVGTAMREAGAKALEDRLLDRTPIQVQDPRNAAHRSPLEENSLNHGTHGKTRKERGFREPFVRSEPRDSVAAPFPCFSVLPVVQHFFIVPFVRSEPRDGFQS